MAEGGSALRASLRPRPAEMAEDGLSVPSVVGFVMAPPADALLLSPYVSKSERSPGLDASGPTDPQLAGAVALPTSAQSAF